MAIYFTSDLHLRHANIINLCNRPFKNIQEMDNTILRNWNNTIKEEDLVYLLGDISLRGPQHYPWYKATIPKLHGEKVLILGNHDYLKPFQYLKMGFSSVHTSLCLESKWLFLVHDPINKIYAPKNYNVICGHVHEKFKFADGYPKTINVGVDIWGYKPVSLFTIQEELKQFKP